MPPQWLIWVTIPAFLAFTLVYGAQLAGDEPESVPELDVDEQGSGLLDSIKGLISFFRTLFTFVTFGAFTTQVQFPFILSILLFLLVTVPWTVIFVSAIVEGVKAIGGLIPFT